MPFHFIATRDAPAPDPWTSYFDNTKWAEDFKGTWNGAQSRWETEDGGQLYIVPTGSWYVDYRPSKIRVTYELPIPGDPDLNIDLWDNCSTWTPSLTDPGGTYPWRASLEEIIIVGQTADFCELDFASAGLEIYVTNIEFLD